ncbi:MAG: hypothetical protein K2K79_03980 [Paramuribaculum sp.]|nr:hypothetical protein [Paramuribaculum sp.]
MNIIYLHGLSSSGQANTAALLRKLLPLDNVITPDIPVSPIKALQLLLSLAGEYHSDNTIVIGTSMGAMYASQMKGYRRILVNPAFHVSQLLEENEGKELQFFSKREDGAESYMVTETLCHEFEEMEANLECVDDSAPESVIGLFGDADEVCDCRDEYCERYFYWTTFAGGHRLTEQVINDILIPIIEWLKSPDFSLRVYLPFESITSGKIGFIGDMDNYENAYKIYKKGIGRKWYEEIVREYQGKKHYDGRDIDLHFPTLSDGTDDETVQLVYGNRYCRTPSVEIYGAGGVQVTEGQFYINNNIIVNRDR